MKRLNDFIIRSNKRPDTYVLLANANRFLAAQGEASCSHIID